MASVFSKIIAGELPGRFVYRDDTVAAFLTIEPVAYGHTLVVPVEEVDRWTDLDPALWAHLNEVAQRIGAVIVDAFDAPRAGYLIAGFEVPHTHLHVIPLRDETDILLSKAAPASDEELDSAITALREALLSAGHGRHVPPSMGSSALA